MARCTKRRGGDSGRTATRSERQVGRVAASCHCSIQPSSKVCCGPWPCQLRSVVGKTDGRRPYPSTKSPDQIPPFEAYLRQALPRFCFHRQDCSSWPPMAHETAVPSPGWHWLSGSRLRCTCTRRGESHAPFRKCKPAPGLIMRKFKLQLVRRQRAKHPVQQPLKQSAKTNWGS